MKLLVWFLLLAVGAHLAASSVVLTVAKTPFEALTCSMDFTPEAGADGITLVSVTSKNVATGVDTSASIIATSPVPAVFGSTDKVIFRVQNGRIGETHQISVKVTDAMNGDKLDGDMLLSITN